MNSPVENWQPDPQLLAAYFDGELEARVDCADVRARVEAWLDAHPEAAEEWAKHRKLQQLWLETTPADPVAAAWSTLLDRIDAKRREPVVSPPRHSPWWAMSIVAASVALCLSVSYALWRANLAKPHDDGPIAVAPKETPKEIEDEVFAVATADEITIFRVSGADTAALVVGTLPLAGELDFAEHGDVRVLAVHPDAQDQMMPTVRHDRRKRPMIWARLDTD